MPDADLLGREERIEDPVDDLRRDADTAVGHVSTTYSPAATLPIVAAPRCGRARHPAARATCRRRHRLHGIRCQVHQNLVHLRRVAKDRRAARAQASTSRRRLPAASRPQVIQRLARHPLDVHGDVLADAAAAERRVSLDQCAAALAGRHDAVQVAPQPAALGRIAQRHLAVAQDCAEDVVEVVRDATRERTHRLQPLRVAKLLSRVAQLLLGLVLRPSRRT